MIVRLLARLGLLPRFRVLADDVTVNPSAADLPGAALFQKVLDWGGQIALFACLLAVVGGGAAIGWSQRTGSITGATTGKALVLGGAAGAGVVGLAPAIVNGLFRAAG